MNVDERDAFLGRPHTAVLATTRRDGSVHAVPVWYRWDGTAFRIVTGRGSVKHRNVERHARATLCVDEREGRFRYVTAEGPVQVVDPLTRDERLALHKVYYDAERAERNVADNGHEKMVLLLLTPERWTGWSE